MQRVIHRSLPLLIVLLLLAQPVRVQAAETVDSGTFGENITWALTDDGILTISGTGAIPAEGVTTTPWYEYREQITTVIIGDGITDTGVAPFANFHQLEKAVIGDDVTVIGDSAFYYCWNLTEVELGKSVQTIVGASFLFTSVREIVLPEGLKEIGPHSFASCDDLVSITIPNTVTTIGDGAFYGCASLKTVELPDSITSIGNTAFRQSGLTVIKLPKQISALSNELFDSCVDLSCVVLPEGITVIPSGVFDDCTGLTDIYIPASVTQIDSGAFKNTDRSIQNIWYGGSQEQWEALHVDRSSASGLYWSVIHYNSEIPKTADFLTVILPLFLLSGCAAAAMILKKRQ